MDPLHGYQAHSGVVNYVCWDLNGEYMASVSEECVQVWSLASGECIHELTSNGNQFHSCVFHPSYSTLLVVGGNRVSNFFNLDAFLIHYGIIYIHYTGNSLYTGY